MKIERVVLPDKRPEHVEMKSSSVPHVTDPGRIAAVVPALFTVKAAAVYLACSASLLNQMRAADAKRLQRGEPIEGPEWVKLGYGIRYRVADLDVWISRTAVVGGVCEAHRR